MRIRLGDRASGFHLLLVRMFFVIFGVAAIWWGIDVLPVFRQEFPVIRIADRIIAGEPFSSAILDRQNSTIDSIRKLTACRPTALRSAAIIQLRMVEAADNHERASRRLKSLDEAIRSSLSCAPADPFLWLVLYWIENAEEGKTADHLNYLKMSYRLGPNEGWVAVKRSPIAFSLFQKLPPSLREIVLNEFTGLIKSSFYEQAAEIFMGSAWPERDLILSRLEGVNQKDREVFADALYRRGYDGNVPGVVRNGEH